MKNKFLQTKEGNALLKLIFWIIFVAVLLLAFSKNESPSQNNEPSEEKPSVKSFKNISDMEKALLVDNLTYKYKVNDNENIIIYEGIRCNQKELWYKENSEGITKYIKENEKTYKLNLNEKEEYFEEETNLSNLFNTLNEYSYTEDKNDLERSIKYSLGTLEVTIKTNLENITNILVIKDSIRYEMQFTKIGICDKINLEI